jgi:hypothetical protein
MRKTLFRRFAVWALAAAWFGAMTSAATAGSFTRECAARDMQILMMIEQQEDTNTVSLDKLNDAMLTMLHARIVCHEGHVLDALAIYDGIAQSITPESHALNRVPVH